MNVKTKELQKKHFVSVRKERSEVSVAQGALWLAVLPGTAQKFPSKRVAPKSIDVKQNFEVIVVAKI